MTHQELNEEEKNHCYCFSGSMFKLVLLWARQPLQVHISLTRHSLSESFLSLSHRP